MSDQTVPKSDTPDIELESLRALLRDVTAQRDKLLTQYEAMALQVDELTREINDDILQARESAKKAEASEHHAMEAAARAEEEAARVNELTRQLDEERRKSADIAAEFARFRLNVGAVSGENPRAMLLHALSLILRDCVAWTRAKIPTDSPFLPWFDRAIELATKAGRLAAQWAGVFIEWATPRAIDAWKWLKSEVAKHVGKQ